MLNLHEQFIEEEYAPDGQLEHFRAKYDDSFNFGYDVVDAIAAAEPDRPALIWCNPEGEEHRFSFGDIKKWSDKCANLFAQHGIGRGDKVLVVLRRHYQFWFVATALHKLGAVMVPATFMLKEHDLDYRLQSAEIKAVVCTDVGYIADVMDASIPRCPSVQVRFLVGGAGGGTCENPASAGFGAALSDEAGLCKAAVTREGWIDFNTELLATPESFTRVETNAADPFLMYFSSGTSGNPKMVLHNSGYAIAHTLTAKHWHNVKSDGGVHFTIADTGWGKAVWGKYYGQWIMEACVLAYDFDRFDAAEILGLISKYHVTTLCCPPTMYRMFMEADVDGFDLSSLEYCTTAGEALNPDLFAFWQEHTGLTIFEGFGQTETPLTIANLTGSAPKPGSMGKPSPQYELQIQLDDGTEARPGQTGEICIHMDANTHGIMMEYYRNPEKTTEAIHDGWYHTGDTAWADEDGYIWYVGRNDDVIKSSGYRIGPFEIESVLLEHEAVRECAVTGVPDELRGYAVKATIVLSDGFVGGAKLTRELQTYVKQQTAPYKYPRIIDYVDELPKTVNGKIRRVAIRKADEEAAHLPTERDKTDGLV